MAHDKRYLTDAQSMDALIESMPPAEREDYLNYKFRTMEACFPGRRMVVYELKDGQPTNVDSFGFGELAVGVKGTPTAKLHFRNREHLVTPTPTRIPGRDVFLHLPQNFIFRWAGQEINGGLEFRAHYAILIKTRSRDALDLDDQTYCVTLKRFLERYPRMADEVRY